MDNGIIIAVLAALAIVVLLWILLGNRASNPVLPEAKEAKPAVEPPAPPAEAEAPAAAPSAQVDKPDAKPPAKAAARKTTARKAEPKPKAAGGASAKAPATTKAGKAKAKGAAAPAAPPAMTAIGIPAAVGMPDNLLLLKGVGPKLNTLLAGLGISRFDQIGAWTAEDAAKVDAHLGAFKGRIERDAWIEQAGLLAKGEIAAFESRFGKLDSEN